MHNFKVGDRVEFRPASEVEDNDNRWGYGYLEGRKATVTSLDRDILVLSADDGRPMASAFHYRVKLIDRAKHDFRTGDKVRFRDESFNDREAGPYVIGRKGVVEDGEVTPWAPNGYHLVHLKAEDREGLSCFAYRLELDVEEETEVVNEEAPEERPLIGPKPEAIPVYPTPWTVVNDEIRDADGAVVADVYNPALAELIKNLVNAHAEKAAQPKFRFFARGLDDTPDVYRFDLQNNEVRGQYYSNSGGHLLSGVGLSDMTSRYGWAEITEAELPSGYFGAK